MLETPGASTEAPNVMSKGASAGESGATAVEYSILAAAIAAVIVAVVLVVGTRSCVMFEDASTKVADGFGGEESSDACL